MNKNKKYCIFAIIGLLYGLILWIQTLLLTNLKNTNSNNLLGININISNSQLKSLILSFIISGVYTIKDIYEYS